MKTLCSYQNEIIPVMENCDILYDIAKIIVEYTGILLNVSGWYELNGFTFHEDFDLIVGDIVIDIKFQDVYYPKDIIQCVLYCIIFDLEKFGLYLAKTGYLCLFILTENDMKTFKDLFCDAITERGRKINQSEKTCVKQLSILENDANIHQKFPPNKLEFCGHHKPK